MIVTIDGPSGSGKSTAARTLALRLGLEYLDTGAMFRAMAWHLDHEHVDVADEDAVARRLDSFGLVMAGGLVSVNGTDITTTIRTPAVTSASSRIAVYPHVRTFLAEQQRRIADGRRIICEGRDQGTVVFPNALVKFFLTASAEVRARRRHLELQARGESVSFEEVLEAQAERDRRDSSRATAPLVAADDAICLDTSDMELAEMLDRMEADIRARAAA